MTRLGIGASLMHSCTSSQTVESKTNTYRLFTLIFTFLIYTSFHLSRKPISVVKDVLHLDNCTIGNETIINNETRCSWAPFENYDYLGSLDYAYLFAYAVGMFLSGHIAERVDLRYFLSAGMILSGIFTALFGFGYYWNIHSLPYYLIIQIVGGLVQATGWPSVVTCVANWFGKGKRGVIMGIWNSHTSVGNILGSLIAAVWVERMWGLSFIVPGAIITFLGCLVFLLLVPKPEDVDCQPPDHSSRSSHKPVSPMHRSLNWPMESEALINENGSAGAYQTIPTENNSILSTVSPEREHEEKAISMWKAIQVPGVAEFSLCLFFAKLVSYTFLYWLPNYIQYSSGYDPSVSADLSTLFDVGGVIGGIFAGIISDVTEGRATTCIVMLALAAPSLYLYETFGTTSWGTNIALLMVSGALVNGPYALITTAVSADLGTHESLKGNSKALSTVTAIIDGTGSLGAALGPLLTSFISQAGSWTDVFYMLIAADAAAMLLLSRLVFKEVRGWCNSNGRIQQS